ncbi:hypothetical protein Tco_1389556, partial [Tanacetum coccineum]
EGKRLRLFQNSLLDQASNWLERLLAGSISTWEDLTTLSIHLKSEIDRATDGKLCDKNAEESWEIIENLALYVHEGWNDPSDFAKPVKAISLPQEPKEVVDMKKEVEDGTNNEPITSVKEVITEDGIEELAEMPRSQPMGYNLKHEINAKLIEGLIGKQRYNDSLLATRLGKMDYETYNSLPVGPIYNAILKRSDNPPFQG